MSELTIVSAAGVASLAWAGARALVLRRSAAGNHELERLLGAVERAGADFSWQAARRLGLLLMAVLALLALALELRSAASPAADGAWLLLSAAAGAAGAVVIAHLARWACNRATADCLAALRNDLDTAAAAVFRGAAFTAALVDGASLLLTLALLAGPHLAANGLVGASAAAAFAHAAVSLPAAALGAVAAATIYQIGGSSFQTAAGIAASSARTRDRKIAHDEDQNPALVAELVGNTLGGVVCRSTDVFAALLLGNTMLVLVAGAAGAPLSGSPALDGALFTLGSLPLVVRASGLAATLVAFASVRFEGNLTLSSIFVAARVGHLVMALTGLCGATLWLLGDPAFWLYSGAGALGALGCVLASALLLLAVRRSLGGERPSPAERASVARAIGLGLQQTWPPLLTVGLCLAAAAFLGSRAPLAHGGVLALVIAVTVMLGGSAFDLGESLFASITENVSLISRLGRGKFDAAARGRADEIAQAGLVIGHLGQARGILGAASTALLLALMSPFILSEPSTSNLALGFASPLVLLGGILGAGSVSFHVGGLLRAASRGASTLDGELSERRAPSESPDPDSPILLPSYRASVELAAKAALAPLLPLAFGVLAIPFSIALGLRAVYGSSGALLAAQMLMAFGVLAAATGAVAALMAQGTLMELGAARGAAKAPTEAWGGDPAREFLGRCVGPAALLGLKAVVIASFATAPLLF